MTISLFSNRRQRQGYSLDPISCKSQNWLSKTLEDLEVFGFSILTEVIPEDLRQDAKVALRRTSTKIKEEIGEYRLMRAQEMGVCRLPCSYDSVFFKFLEFPEMLEVIDRTVSNTAILHLQNGFILPSQKEEERKKVFQNSFHRDFPRYLNGYLASINFLFALDEFRSDNGATLVVPGSHQKPDPPSQEEMTSKAVPAVCPAGAVIIFDSTLWHAAGHNFSGEDRMAINQQFTRSYIKQQIDSVRAIGEETVCKQAPRTQQILGYYTRVVTSLDEYYQPEEKRLYRKGQG